MLAIIQNSPRFAFGREIHIPSSLLEANVLLMNTLVLYIEYSMLDFDKLRNEKGVQS